MGNGQSAQQLKNEISKLEAQLTDKKVQLEKIEKQETSAKSATSPKKSPGQAEAEQDDNDNDNEEQAGPAGTEVPARGGKKRRKKTKKHRKKRMKKTGKK